MAELIKFTGAAAAPISGIGKHTHVWALVGGDCTAETSKVTSSKGDDDIRSIRTGVVVLLEEDQVEQFRNQIAEARARQGEVDPRQSSFDDDEHDGNRHRNDDLGDEDAE